MYKIHYIYIYHKHIKTMSRRYIYVISYIRISYTYHVQVDRISFYIKDISLESMIGSG